MYASQNCALNTYWMFADAQESSFVRTMFSADVCRAVAAMIGSTGRKRMLERRTQWAGEQANTSVQLERPIYLVYDHSRRVLHRTFLAKSKLLTRAHGMSYTIYHVREQPFLRKEAHRITHCIYRTFYLGCWAIHVMSKHMCYV